MDKIFTIIGYSGHAYVVCDIISSMGNKVVYYFEKEEKSTNPYQLSYSGSEQSDEGMVLLKESDWFIAIGNNQLRKIIYNKLMKKGLHPSQKIQHSSAIVSSKVTIGNGTMIGQGTIINAMVEIGEGVIINSGAIVEHECKIGNFAHIAPGAVLAGNVSVGERSFVGANAVVKEGIKIGTEVRIGAGSVIIKDIPDKATVVGNPGRIISIKK